jgi:hypothetical protein
MADIVEEALDSADAQPGTPFEPTAYRVLVDDPDGGHCEVAGQRPAVGGAVLAVAPLLPGDNCTGS